jgi:hypothetical protein
VKLVPTDLPQQEPIRTPIATLSLKRASGVVRAIGSLIDDSNNGPILKAIREVGFLINGSIVD